MEAISWRPRYLTSMFASLLADYIEAFRPPPDHLTWTDFDIYRLFQAAKSEYTRALMGKSGNTSQQGDTDGG